MPAPSRPLPRLRRAVHVCLDPGVPAFGTKGSSVHVQSVLAQLLRCADEVHLVTVRTGGAAPSGLEGVVVHELPRPTGVDAAAREEAQRRTDAEASALVADILRAAGAAGADGGGDARPDLLYQRYSLWSGAVLEAARARGTATVLEVNAPLVEEQLQHRELSDPAGARALTCRALAASDAPFGVSGPVARWASAHDPRGRQLPVVPNGVDVSRFVPRLRAALTGPEPLVAWVGTFKPWHGVEALVTAAAAARAAGAPVRLLLVGDGPQRGPVLARAASLGVPVEAPGAVAPGAVPALLARADLAAAPYPAGEHYFSPLKVVEYLAAGLPTVASAIADLPDLLGDDEALLVPPGDVGGLARALAHLATDTADRARYAEAGRRAAVERFGWDAVLARALAPLQLGVGEERTGSAA